MTDEAATSSAGPPVGAKQGLHRVAATVLAGLAATCIVPGTAIGLLWALSNPSSDRHSRLYLGLPGGVLFLQGVLWLASARLFRSHRVAVRAAAVLAAVALPLALLLSSPFTFVYAGSFGLLPFRLIESLHAIMRSAR